ARRVLWACLPPPWSLWRPSPPLRRSSWDSGRWSTTTATAARSTTTTGCFTESSCRGLPWAPGWRLSSWASEPRARAIDRGPSRALVDRSARESCTLRERLASGGALQLGDVEFLHLQHRRHHPLRFLNLRVA